MSISRFEFVMFYFFVFFCLSPGFVSPLPLLGACIPPFLPPSVFFCTFFFCYSLHVFISCRFRLFAEQLLVAVTLTSVIFFFTLLGLLMLCRHHVFVYDRASPFISHIVPCPLCCMVVLRCPYRMVMVCIYITMANSGYMDMMQIHRYTHNTHKHMLCV